MSQKCFLCGIATWETRLFFRYKCIRILWIYIWKIECVRGGLPDECVG